MNNASYTVKYIYLPWNSKNRHSTLMLMSVRRTEVFTNQVNFQEAVWRWTVVKVVSCRCATRVARAAKRMCFFEASWRWQFLSPPHLWNCEGSWKIKKWAILLHCIKVVFMLFMCVTWVIVSRKMLCLHDNNKYSWFLIYPSSTCSEWVFSVV